MGFRDDILAKRNQRIESGLQRKLATVDSPQGIEVVCDGKRLVNFSSNDYLGLASSEELKTAAKTGVEQWGVGTGASHLVCGHQTPHVRLEQELAEFVGAEKAVVFSTGYMANLAVPAAFLDRHDLLLQDKLNHASLIDAGMLCRAKSRRYRHLDVEHAGEWMSDASFNRSMLATDGVFSMNGNIANVSALASLCEQEYRLLVVDDAHGFGVLGEHGAGTLEQSGVSISGQILMIGTLSKAVGSFGAFVAGDLELIDHLVQFARPYIYTTALPPSIVEASRQSVRLMRSQSWRRERLRENVDSFRQLAQEFGVELLPSETPIQSVVFDSPTEAVDASEQLADAGFLVVAIRPPTVPEGTSRLRITLCALHESKQIRALVENLAVAPGHRGSSRN